MRKILKQRPLKIRGSMTLTGDLDKGLVELKKEGDQSLERLIDRLKGLTIPRKANGWPRTGYQADKVES